MPSLGVTSNVVSKCICYCFLNLSLTPDFLGPRFMLSKVTWKQARLLP